MKVLGLLIEAVRERIDEGIQGQSREEVQHYREQALKVETAAKVKSAAASLATATETLLARQEEEGMLMTLMTMMIVR